MQMNVIKNNMNECMDNVCGDKESVYNSVIPTSLVNEGGMNGRCCYYEKEEDNVVCYEYVLLRKKGISYIKDIVNVLKYSKGVLYKAILYLDTYFLRKQCYNINIYQISTICILISVQFNECCINNNIKELSILLHCIPHLLQLEQDILTTLNYNLGMLTVYDYINTFFSYGVLFTSNAISHEDIFEAEYVLSYAMNILFMLVDDYCFLDFTPHVMAITIIRIALENSAVSFDDIHFQKVYDVNFHHIDYVKCLFVLKAILPYVMKDERNSNRSINNNNICITNINKRDVYHYSLSLECGSSSTLDYSNYSL